MVEALATSAVNMTLFGHMEDSQALEIEPFFPLPLLKRSISSTTQKLRFNQASSNMRLLSGPMKFNFHQRNKGEFSFVEHLNKAKARIFYFIFFKIEHKNAGHLVRTQSCSVHSQTLHFNCKLKIRNPSRLFNFKMLCSFLIFTDEATHVGWRHLYPRVHSDTCGPCRSSLLCGSLRLKENVRTWLMPNNVVAFSLQRWWWWWWWVEAFGGWGAAKTNISDQGCWVSSPS